MKEGIIKRYKKLSTGTAVILAGLLLGFYTVTLFFGLQIYNQVLNIKEHPFPVVVAVGDVKASVSQMRMLSERLVFLRSEEVLEGAERYYTEIDEDCKAAVQIIVEQYLSSYADALRMQEVQNEVMEKQDELLTLCRQSEAESQEVGDYVQTEITPRLNEMDEILESINQNASKNFDAFADQAKSYRDRTLLFSTILTIGVLTALAIYLYILHKKEVDECRMQQEMEDALAAAQVANAAKSRFLSNMSHDIRTPLNAIIGMTNIAVANLEDTRRVSDCLGKITTSSKHLLELINDVMDMNKIESGKIAIREEIFNLAELIDNTVTIIQPQLKTKQLEFKLSVEDIENELVVGDTLHLQQVLINLLGNAVKFTPSGGQIEFKLNQISSLNQEQGNFEFVVSDNGIGMTAEFLERIFEPFERANTSTVSRTEGTGLGMAITKHIVDTMGGRIFVDSRIGEGTVCTVQLQMKIHQGKESEISSDPEFDAGALDTQKENTENLHRKDGKALLVEDNELNAEIAEEMLKQERVSISSVSDGLQAVEKMKQTAEGDFDIIFMDVQMPVMDGYEATREIRKFERENSRKPIAIVGMSANAFTEDVENAIEAGMDDYITKPVSPDELRRVLDTYI